jgi:hypothetical protein
VHRYPEEPLPDDLRALGQGRSIPSRPRPRIRSKSGTAASSRRPRLRPRRTPLSRSSPALRTPTPPTTAGPTGSAATTAPATTANLPARPDVRSWPRSTARASTR